MSLLPRTQDLEETPQGQVILKTISPTKEARSTELALPGKQGRKAIRSIVPPNAKDQKNKPREGKREESKTILQTTARNQNGRKAEEKDHYTEAMPEGAAEGPSSRTLQLEEKRRKVAEKHKAKRQRQKRLKDPEMARLETEARLMAERGEKSQETTPPIPDRKHGKEIGRSPKEAHRKEEEKEGRRRKKNDCRKIGYSI